MSLTKEQKIKARMLKFSDIPPNMRHVLDAYKTKIAAGRSGDYYEGYGDALQIVAQAIKKAEIVRTMTRVMGKPSGSADDMDLVSQAIGVLAICLGELMSELDDEATELADGEKEDETWIPSELVG